MSMKENKQSVKSPKKKEELSNKDLKDLMKSPTPPLHRKRGGALG